MDVGHRLLEGPSLTLTSKGCGCPGMMASCQDTGVGASGEGSADGRHPGCFLGDPPELEVLNLVSDEVAASLVGLGTGVAGTNLVSACNDRGSGHAA